MLASVGDLYCFSNIQIACFIYQFSMHLLLLIVIPAKM